MARKIKRYKVGLESETFAISMVDEPAIEQDFIALAKDNEEVKVTLASEERHICYGPVLIPEKDIYRNNGKQEFYINFSEESIQKMSQDFMKEYRQHEVNLQHSDEQASDVFVVESWLVEDPYRDKANYLGFNVPKNTWMIGMKVNNDDVWNKIKSGELNGFSVESLISLEEFAKQDDMQENENFWTKLKGIINEALGKSSYAEEELAEEIKEQETEIIETELEEEKPVETPPVEPKPEEPTDTPPEPKEEPQEPEKEPEEPKEEPKEDNNLEELIKNLNEEIKALKEMNEGLKEKVKDISKQPSAKPIKANAKPNPETTYAAWREQVRSFLS